MVLASSPGAAWPLRTRGAVGSDGPAAWAATPKAAHAAAPATVVVMTRRVGTVAAASWVRVIGEPPRVGTTRSLSESWGVARRSVPETEQPCRTRAPLATTRVKHYTGHDDDDE